MADSERDRALGGEDRLRKLRRLFKIPVDGGRCGTPSAIAQTMRDWPRPASPATNTPGSSVSYSAVRSSSPREVKGSCSCGSIVWRSGPVKPMASSTRSAGSSRSVPAFGPRDPSARNSVSARRMARTRPDSSPMNSTVEAWNARSPPSSCEVETSNSVGVVGHGWCAGRSVGGSLPIARFVTEAAP